MFVQMDCQLYVLPNQRPGCLDLVARELQKVHHRKLKSETWMSKYICSYHEKWMSDTFYQTWEVEMQPWCSRHSLLPGILKLIPVMLGESSEWSPLYSNRGFILHVNPRNLGFGRLTWFRKFKRKWVTAIVTAHNEMFMTCFTHAGF